MKTNKLRCNVTAIQFSPAESNKASYSSAWGQLCHSQTLTRQVELETGEMKTQRDSTFPFSFYFHCRQSSTCRFCYFLFDFRSLCMFGIKGVYGDLMIRI